jgi:hypothetical protein
MRTGTVALAIAVLALSSPIASAAPCATACKDEIRNCMSQECQGLKPRARMRCKRARCSKPIVADCLNDLSVCGATSARPPSHPAPTHPAPTHPAPTPGGW